ncbi:MAG: hypothetical protein VW405_05835, partial [Rhodospirillaceae bacterium]
MTAATTHEKLLALLDANGATYRVIKHEPEGRSEVISQIRGNDPGQAMKAIVLTVRGGGGGKRAIMAVIPGDRRLDMK